ncbi:MAG: hypothetical protein ACRDHG_09890 [Anaerolineales bacterium]
MDQELLVGVLLIIVGLAIGLIAIALVLNRRAAREEQPVEAPDPPDAAEDSHPEIDVPVATQSDAAPVAAAVPDEPKPAAAVSLQPKLVAEIYRDESRGGLILRTAGHDYRAISQIEDEQLRMDLTILASDLTGRFGEAVRTTAPASVPRTPARPGSRSMLEGINTILQRAIAEAGNKAKGVQLIPDAAGGVKVLIGLKSYGLDEVPDEEIRRLIRESVAEWEASQ